MKSNRKHRSIRIVERDKTEGEIDKYELDENGLPKFIKKEDLEKDAKTKDGINDGGGGDKVEKEEGIGKKISEKVEEVKEKVIGNNKEDNKKEDDMKEDDMKKDDMKEDDMKKDDMKEDDIKEDNKKEDNKKEDDMKKDDMKEDDKKEDNKKEDDMKEDDKKEDDMKEDDMKKDDMKEDDKKEDNKKEDDMKEDDKKEDDMKEDDIKKDDMKEDDIKKDDMKEDDMKEDNKKEDDMKKDDKKEDDMKKDDMKKDDKKEDDMKKDDMKKDDMKEDDMKKDDMKKDDMKKDDMKEDDMKKDDMEEDDKKEDNMKKDDMKSEEVNKNKNEDGNKSVVFDENRNQEYAVEKDKDKSLPEPDLASLINKDNEVKDDKMENDMKDEIKDKAKDDKKKEALKQETGDDNEPSISELTKKTRPSESEEKSKLLAAGNAPTIGKSGKAVKPIVDEEVLEHSPEILQYEDEESGVRNDLPQDCDISKERSRNNVSIEGKVYKRRFFFSCCWHERYFVLTKDGDLKYYADPTKNKHKGIVNLKSVLDMQRQDDNDSSHPYKIVLKYLNFEDELAFDSETKRNKWALKMSLVRRNALK